MESVPVGLVSLYKGENRYRDIFIDRRPDEDTQGRCCVKTGLKGCIYKPRNTRDCWKPPEAGRGKEGSSARAVRESTDLPTL